MVVIEIGCGKKVHVILLYRFRMSGLKLRQCTQIYANQ